jgi:hypothetical protein
MNLSIKRPLLFTFFIAAINLGFSQSNEIIIRYIGNCGLHITDGTTNIYSDFPYVSGFNQYVEYDDSELDNIKDNSFFLFTHIHPDHYSRRRMNRVLKEKNGKKFGKWNIAELENLSSKIPDFNIQVFKTEHFLSRHHYSYLITWHGKRFFLSGDTEYTNTIAKIKNIDWLFMPPWLVRKAFIEEKIKVDFKMVAVYHIGTKDRISLGNDKFLELNEQGKMISIPY